MSVLPPADLVVASYPVPATRGTLRDRVRGARAGSPLWIFAVVVYANSGVAYLAVSEDGDTLLVQTAAVKIQWLADPGPMDRPSPPAS